MYIQSSQRGDRGTGCIGNDGLVRNVPFHSRNSVGISCMQCRSWSGLDQGNGVNAALCRLSDKRRRKAQDGGPSGPPPRAQPLLCLVRLDGMRKVMGELAVDGLLQSGQPPLARGRALGGFEGRRRPVLAVRGGVCGLACPSAAGP